MYLQLRNAFSAYDLFSEKSLNPWCSSGVLCSSHIQTQLCPPFVVCLHSFKRRSPRVRPAQDSSAPLERFNIYALVKRHTNFLWICRRRVVHL